MTDAQQAAPASAVTAQPEKRKIGVLLGIAIFFAPYIFSWFTLRKGHTGVQKGIAFGWMAFLLIAMAVSPKDNRELPASYGSASMTNQAQQAAAAQRSAEQAVDQEREAAPPPPEIRWITEPCGEVSKQWSAQSDMTELQKKALWEQNRFEGMHFKWPLKVVSVDTTFGQLQAQFKCAKGSKSIISDLILSVEDEKLALQLTKNQTYTVHGVLNDWGNIIGLSGDLVEITGN